MAKKQVRQDPKETTQSVSSPQKEDINDHFLPKKSLFRVEEVAGYFDVSVRCIYLWIEHGHLIRENINGISRIPRESILQCRFKKKTMGPII